MFNPEQFQMLRNLKIELERQASTPVVKTPKTVEVKPQPQVSVTPEAPKAEVTDRRTYRVTAVREVNGKRVRVVDIFDCGADEDAFQITSPMKVSEANDRFTGFKTVVRGFRGSK